MAEGERERARVALEAQLAEAKAAQEAPALLKLRELQALAEMAKSGGKFVVGLKPDGLGKD